MEIIPAIILLPVGIGLLIKGADWLIDGAVALAERFGISPLIIGLTIVAMGTSAPEVAASITAALYSKGNIAIGNVIGSNIANLALVGGMCALIRPILVGTGILKKEIPVMILTGLLLYPMLENLQLSRTNGIILIGIFLGLIGYTVRQAVYQVGNKPDELPIPADLSRVKDVDMPLWKSIVLIGLGLVFLAGGANLTVWSASTLGKALGISEAVIGITIVAIGTSLPELVTCVVAAVKGQDDISIGNLVGSNIFNTLLVVGVAGLARPFEVEARFIGIDFWIMIGVSLVFMALAIPNRRIGRLSGGCLLVGYVAYMIYLFIFTRTA